MSGRGLTTFEEDEARVVFAASLDFSRVRIHEETAWPDRIASIGARLHSATPPSHNAITLGNQMYFPVILGIAEEDGDQQLTSMAWLIHELTHCWQYQHGGAGYFLKALWAQIRLGSDAYAYGWQAGLRQALAEGDTLADFNPEQQGEITRHYYYRLKRGLDTSAWLPWIQAIRAAEL